MKKRTLRAVLLYVAMAVTVAFVVGGIAFASCEIKKDTILETDVFAPEPKSIVYCYERFGGEYTFTRGEAKKIYEAFEVLMTKYTEIGGCGCGDWHVHDPLREGCIQFRYDQKMQYTGALPNSARVDWSSMHFDTICFCEDIDALFISVSTDGVGEYLQDQNGKSLGAHLHFEQGALKAFLEVVNSCLE